MKFFARPGLTFQDIFCLATRMNLVLSYLPDRNMDLSLQSRIQKKQSMQWKHPGSYPPKKFKRVLSTGKMIASIFG
jgi:hypothetical protein